MPKNRKALMAYAAILAPITGVLIFHAYLGSYTRFIADDYCSAYLGQRFGLLRYIWFWYLNWGGRFSAIAADMLLAWSQPQGIGFVTAATLTAWSIGLTLAIFNLLPDNKQSHSRWRVSIALALIVLFVTLLLTPNVPQSFYWYSAFRTHSLPLVIFSLYMAAYAYFRSLAFSKPTTWAWIIGSFGFALLNAGFSEAFTVMQILCLAIWAGVEWKTAPTGSTQKNAKFLLAALAGAALTILVMLSAPGNANRQQAFYQPSGLLEILSIAITGYLALWQSFFLSPEKPIGLLGAILSVFAAGTQTHTQNKPAIAKISVIVLLGWLLPLASFLPAAYGIGDALPERAQPIPIFFITAALLTAAFQTGVRHANTAPKALTAALGTALLVISASLTLYQMNQSRHLFIEYAERMDRVEQDILAAKKDEREVIHIPRLNNWAGTFDPTDNPHFFSTACISLYYGIQVIGPNPFEP